ncbi:Eco57I restriction-modification methylase domain-containing protein [bacterium]|nr:Eco57I restriction-modification methylase domain-containing protein [bacterium]
MNLTPAFSRTTSFAKAYVSFIVSRAFLEAYKADKLRGWFVSHAAIRELIDFQNFHVFKGVGITTSIITLRADQRPGNVAVYKLNNSAEPLGDLSQNLGNRSLFEHHVHSQTSLSSAPWNLVGAVDQGLNAKIDAAGVPIGNILAIGQGMQTGLNEVFGNRTLKEINDWNVPEGMSFRRASNTDIQRYEVRDRGEYLLYLEEVHDFAALPKGIQVHLKKHEPRLKERAAFLRGNCLWWQYTWPLHKEWYGRPRIYCPYLAKINRFALDRERAFIGLTDTTVEFTTAYLSVQQHWKIKKCRHQGILLEWSFQTSYPPDRLLRLGGQVSPSQNGRDGRRDTGVAQEVERGKQRAWADRAFAADRGDRPTDRPAGL